MWLLIVRVINLREVFSGFLADWSLRDALAGKLLWELQEREEGSLLLRYGGNQRRLTCL